MAIAFELSANFGSNEEAAKRFCEACDQRPHMIEIAGRQIDLHRPLLSRFKNRAGGSDVEVSILPVAVGYGVALDRNRKRIELNTEELSELGRKLYDLLRGVDGYMAARVGWDVDPLDPAELREECAEEIRDGSLHGLVVSTGVRRHFPSSEHFVPFDENYDWIPYRGTKAI